MILTKHVQHIGNIVPGGSHEVKAFLAATFSYNDSIIAANWKIYYAQYPCCHAGPIIDKIHSQDSSYAFSEYICIG